MISAEWRQVENKNLELEPMVTGGSMYKAWIDDPKSVWGTSKVLAMNPKINEHTTKWLTYHAQPPVTFARSDSSVSSYLTGINQPGFAGKPLSTILEEATKWEGSTIIATGDGDGYFGAESATGRSSEDEDPQEWETRSSGNSSYETAKVRNSEETRPDVQCFSMETKEQQENHHIR